MYQTITLQHILKHAHLALRMLKGQNRRMEAKSTLREVFTSRERGEKKGLAVESVIAGERCRSRQRCPGDPLTTRVGTVQTL